MFVREISMIAVDLDDLLDQYETEDSKKDKRRLLERSLMLSIRGLTLLGREPLIASTRARLNNMRSQFSDNVQDVLEELRQDSTTLELFLGAECRLLEDLGLNEAAIARIRTAMERSVEEGKALSRAQGEDAPWLDSSALASGIEELVGILEYEFRTLYDDERHTKLLKRLIGVFEVLGGALIVAGNAAAGAAAAPATVGLSTLGAAASTAIGTDVLGRGMDQVRNSD